MTTKTLALNNIERKLFWVLVSLISVCVAISFYSMMSLSVNGVERDRMTRTAHEMSTLVGNLEQEYLTAQSEITLASAQDLGFHEVAAKFTGTDTAAKLSFAR